MLRAHPYRRPISRAHPYPGPIPAQDALGLIYAQDPYMPRAHPCLGHVHPEGPWGPSMSRASPGPIHPGGPIGAHPYRGPISSQSSSIPMAYGMGAHLCSGPSISSVYSGLSMLRAHPCEDPSLPRAHLFREHKGPSMPRACSYQVNIPAQGPSISRAHGSPFMPAYPWRGSIPVQGPSSPRAPGCPFLPGPIHPEGPRVPINAQGPSIPRAHPCLGPIPVHGPSIPTHGDLSISRTISA